MNPTEINKYRIYWAVYPNGVAKPSTINRLSDGEIVPIEEWEGLGLDLSDRPCPVPPTDPIPPQWTEFRMAMRVDVGYRRIVSSVPTLLAVDLQNAIAQPSPHIPAVAQIWGEIIQVTQPTNEEISRWNAIASSHFIPFEFRENGGIGNRSS